MAAQVFRPGATALITGGASGVGFAMAKICRGAGMNVALVDRHQEHLKSAKQHLTSMAANSAHPAVTTETYDFDVGDVFSWQDFKVKFRQTFDHIDILMLNAGTSVKPTTAQSYEDLKYFHQTFQTNLWGVLNGLAEFLPAVQQRATAGHKTAIIITGSKQGITNPPGAGNPAYNMSKSALKTLAEHLAHDLRTPGPSHSPNTSVHLLIPGWTFTGLSGNPGPVPSAEMLAHKNAGAWLPEQVAAYAVQKIAQAETETEAEAGTGAGAGPGAGAGAAAHVKTNFYIVCPDNDVDEALDQARMAWHMGDVTQGRPPLSRWDERTKDQAAEWIQRDAETRRGSGR